MGNIINGCEWDILSRIQLANYFADIDFNRDVMSWYHDAKNTELVDEWERNSFETMLPLEKYHFWGAQDRSAPLEQRFPAEHVPKLRELKKKWDPEGVFPSMEL